jgi:hypothetical protein
MPVVVGAMQIYIPTENSGCYMRHAWVVGKVASQPNPPERVADEVAVFAQNGCP